MTATHNDRSAPLSAEAILRTVKTDTTLAEISDIILALPKVRMGIIQKIHSLSQRRVGRQPGSDAWQEADERKREYRCFIRTDKAHADRTGPDLLKVIREVLTAVKIEMSSL